jgi:hypothetical protein
MSSLQHDDGFVQTREGGLLTKPKISPKDVVMRDDAGRTLYCGLGLYGTLAAPQYTEPVYLHASCQQAALVQFHHFHRHIRFSQVWVAPAVGFFVHDNHGDVLSTGGTRPAANPLDRGTEYEEAR